MNEKPDKMRSGRKRTRKNAFSGNHQRGWMWGHHAVTETLATGVWPVSEIFANQKAFEQSSALLLAKQKAGIPLEMVSSERLTQLCNSSEHQGLIARMGAFPYRTIDEITSQLRQFSEDFSSGDPQLMSKTTPLVVICDRLQDAFNFGAVLRCCDGANVLGVIVGDHSQAEVTPHVARSSSGAVNHLSIVRVADLVAASLELKELGMQLVAADANTDTNVWNSQLASPTALVIGSEAMGVCPELLEVCDQRLCIPMHGKVSSLNAAVAAGILLYEIRRQQFAR